MQSETKWSQFMPADDFKDDPIYGWEVIKKGSDIAGVRFKSGVLLFFKTYEQNVMALQTGTVDALFCDEELPFHLYEELMFRISASDGYFSMVSLRHLVRMNGAEPWNQLSKKLEIIKSFFQMLSNAQFHFMMRSFMKTELRRTIRRRTLQNLRPAVRLTLNI